MKETDLYQAVKEYFEDQGFLVRAEVKDIDICAVRDELLIGIELKRNLSTDLLIQGALRQKLCDLVYIAIPKPKRIRKDRAFNNMLHLLKRLELGLLYIDLENNKALEILEPTFFEMDRARKTLLKKRTALLKEIQRRSLSANTGGSSKKRLLTAYREESLKAIALLRIKGTAAPKNLKEIGLNPTLFRDNYYGWFRKLERGVYTLDEDCSQDYQEYEQHLLRFYTELSENSWK